MSREEIEERIAELETCTDRASQLAIYELEAMLDEEEYDND